MAEIMKSLAVDVTADVPCTLYYACKAIETKEGEVRRSTGWDTFLQVVINAGMQVSETWPMRTERPRQTRSIGSNALASSVSPRWLRRPGPSALAYLLYQKADDKKWANEALAYNTLISAWPALRVGAATHADTPPGPSTKPCCDRIEPRHIHHQIAEAHQTLL